MASAHRNTDSELTLNVRFADSCSSIHHSISLSVLQLMQQQALVAQSAYLSPVATVAAVQMQQLAALNPSSIIATPIASITPSSGNERQRCLALIRFLPEV